MLSIYFPLESMPAEQDRGIGKLYKTMVLDNEVAYYIQTNCIYLFFQFFVEHLNVYLLRMHRGLEFMIKANKSTDFDFMTSRQKVPFFFIFFFFFVLLNFVKDFCSSCYVWRQGQVGHWIWKIKMQSYNSFAWANA